MREPDPRTSRLVIGGGLVAAIAVGGAGFLLGRTTLPEPPTPKPLPVATVTPAASATPVDEDGRVLRRSDLVALAQATADAFASGAAPPSALAVAAGRRFDLVLPFGCTGPGDAASGAPTGWRYDQETETLRVTVAPTAWRAADWGSTGETGADAAAAQGFWINRPWSSAEACPARAAAATTPTGIDAVTLPGQTLALLDFGGLSREDRPFETVQRVPAAGFDGSRGFLLRITGRLASEAPGPVRCVQPGGVDQRPICALAATVGEISIENAASGAALATWTPGRRGRRAN